MILHLFPDRETTPIQSNNAKGRCIDRKAKAGFVYDPPSPTSWILFIQLKSNFRSKRTSRRLCRWILLISDRLRQIAGIRLLFRNLGGMSDNLTKKGKQTCDSADSRPQTFDY